MDSDRLKRALTGFVRSVTHTDPGIDFRALYPAKVVAQNVDLTLELIPDDVRLPSLSKVPLRLGLPGVSAKVAAGSRVLLFFEGGRASAPAAALWQTSSLLELVITASTKVTVNAPDINLGGEGVTVAPVIRSGDNVSIVGFGPAQGVITSSVPTPPLLATKVKA
jgi:hypothetical protein